MYTVGTDNVGLGVELGVGLGVRLGLESGMGQGMESSMEPGMEPCMELGEGIVQGSRLRVFQRCTGNSVSAIHRKQQLYFLLFSCSLILF